MLYNREIDIKYEYDVLICGGGSAGFCAAVSAGRMGVMTGLIDKNNMLGGTLTVGRNNEIGLFNAGDTPIIRGIGWEFCQRLADMGYAKIPEFSWEIRHSKQNVMIDVPMAGVVQDKMCEEAGVKVHYFVTLVDVIWQDDYYIAICARKAKLFGIKAKWIIDCSGDADAAYLAGAEYEMGGDANELQPGTLGFYSTSKKGYVADNAIYREKYDEALVLGELLPNDLWGKKTPADLLFTLGVNAGHVAINTDYTDKIDDIERYGRASVMRIQKWYDKYFPEAEFKVIALAPEVAFRETRRICSEHPITNDDYARGIQHYDDVCFSYYPVDLHVFTEDGSKSLDIRFSQKETPIPGIPFGALVPKTIPNMLVAGRCIGGERLAQSGYRVKSSCMAMGEAAGTAAALIVKNGSHDIVLLRETLVKNGSLVPGM